ncbi:hypothetical protein DSO57_1002236 [Entomophthora muscae]|uniref:Uncharacterized protein n=1 Tax=Entomophthora muscae TaxID=34485 RepID=A0ACC2SYJ5_9FUNG|nr:hypothetical protein DSO57_1002236 [Entomophthora muscae]
MFSVLIILLAIPTALFFYFLQKSSSKQDSYSKLTASEPAPQTPSKKSKAKAKKQAKKAEAIAEPAAPKQTKAEAAKEKKVSREAVKVVPESTPEPVVATPEAPASTKKNKKKKKAAKAENKNESTPAVIETPAPTPELVHEDAPENNGAESEPSDFVEATKPKKKNKKSKAAKVETPSVTESILPEPKDFADFIDESEFTKPTKTSVAKPSNRFVKGVSERKPVESANPWALLADE